METSFRSPVKIVLRLQDSLDEDLEVDAAFAKSPDVVRDALLEAVRHVELRRTDITLLRIENAFQSVLKTTWQEPKHLRPVLEACRQGKVRNRTERLFFEHGKEYGVVALSVATRQDDHKLFRDIDPLLDDELIKLVENVKRIPKRAVIVEFIEEFLKSPEVVVSNPPPQLPRPRTRKKEHVSHIENSPSLLLADPESSNISQRNKRRRLPSVSDTTTRGSPRVEAQLLSAQEFNLSTRLLPPPSTFLLNLQSALPNDDSLSISKHANTQPQPSLDQEGEWALPQSPGPHISISDLRQSQIISLEEQWEFVGGEFTRGRPRRYDPQQLQIGQEVQWLFTEEDFTRGRPDRYDPQSSHMQEQNGFQFSDP